MNLMLTSEQREAIADSYAIMIRVYPDDIASPYPVLIPDPEYGDAGAIQVWWQMTDHYMHIGSDGGDARIEAILPGVWS